MENHQFDIQEKNTGYNYQNTHLLKHDKTHSKYANDNKAKC